MKTIPYGSTRCCSKCGETLPITMFKQRSSGRRRHHGVCNPCKYEQRKARNHGLTLEELRSLPDACELCGSTYRLCVDHDHKTGKVRGILCRSCNMALGAIGDDLDGVRRLYRYLMRSTSD